MNRVSIHSLTAMWLSVKSSSPRCVYVVYSVCFSQYLRIQTKPPSCINVYRSPILSQSPSLEFFKLWEYHLLHRFVSMLDSILPWILPLLQSCRLTLAWMASWKEEGLESFVNEGMTAWSTGVLEHSSWRRLGCKIMWVWTDSSNSHQLDPSNASSLVWWMVWQGLYLEFGL